MLRGLVVEQPWRVGNLDDYKVGYARLGAEGERAVGVETKDPASPSTHERRDADATEGQRQQQRQRERKRKR
jgi:hypothetical protein